MSDENTNPSGEVSDDELVSRIAGLMSDEPAEEEQAPESVESEQEPEEEAESEAPQVRRHRVKVDGQELEVSEDELLAGYSRQADYTRKTQEVSEQRKALEAERQAAAQARTAYLQQLQAAQQYLASLEPQIDMKQLRETDLVKWMEVRAEQDERRERMAQIQAEQRRVLEHQQQEEYRARAQQLQEAASKLATLIPEYSDANKRSAVQAAIRQYAQSQGFSAEELSDTSDYRAVVVLDKARRYDELMARVKNIKPTVVQTTKPGAIRPPANASKKALERLKQTGSDADAIAAFKSIL